MCLLCGGKGADYPCYKRDTLSLTTYAPQQLRTTPSYYPKISKLPDISDFFSHRKTAPIFFVFDYVVTEGGFPKITQFTHFDYWYSSETELSACFDIILLCLVGIAWLVALGNWFLNSLRKTIDNMF